MCCVHGITDLTQIDSNKCFQCPLEKSRKCKPCSFSMNGIHVLVSAVLSEEPETDTGTIQPLLKWGPGVT